MPRSVLTPPLRVALIYAAVAASWILLSDAALAWLVPTDDAWVLGGIGKGLLFVLTTALLLFGLMRHEFLRLAASHAQLDQTRAKLAESEQRFRLLFERAPLGVAVLRLGRVLFVNPALAAMFGLPNPAAAAGQPLEAFVGPAEREAEIEHTRRRERGAPEPAERETQGQRRDGSLFPMSVRTERVDLPDGPAVLAFVIDITERHQAEMALRRSEALYRTLAENFPNGAVMLFDRDLRHTIAAGRGLAPAGYRRDQIEDHTVSEVFPAEVEAVLAPQYRAALAGQPVQFQLPLGQAVYQLQVVPVHNAAGQVAAGMAILQDMTDAITTRAQLERQLRRMSGLHAVDAAITASLEVQIPLDVLLAEVVHQLGVDAAGVLLLSHDDNHLAAARRRGFTTSAYDHARLRLGVGLTGQAALERRTLYVPDLATAGAEFGRAALVQAERLRGYAAAPLVAKGQLKGMLEVFSRQPLRFDLDWRDYLETLASQAALAIDNVEAYGRLHRSNTELGIAYDATLEGWARALELRAPQSTGHSRRASELVVALGRRAGLAESELVHLRRGALLHDIGKLAIPDDILLKPGPLSAGEWDVVRRHPQTAIDLLAPIVFLKPALDIPLCHHERWDGAGYPRGLAGTAIPLAARLFAVVNVWDALQAPRPYRAAWPAGQALDYVRRMAGIQFDSEVVRLFLELLDEQPDLAAASVDTRLAPE